MTNDIVIMLVIITLLLAFSAFFSGSETALTAVSRSRIRTFEKRGSKAAARVVRLIEDRERLIGAILLGNNLVNILATALMTTLFATLFPGDFSLVLSTIVMTFLVLIFAEITPKTAAIARPESLSMLVSGPMRLITIIFSPVTAVIQWIVRNGLRLVGIDVAQQIHVLSAADELRGALDLQHEEGRVDKDARDIIRGVLDLDETKIEEIMVHRKSMETIDIDQPVKAIINAVIASKYTRIPLWQSNQDNIVGILHSKDLLRALWKGQTNPSQLNLASIAMEPYFVPETTSLQEQLEAFKDNQQHFALIVDEYGGLMGLVTMEDILEEIVGEIEDEYDKPLQGVHPKVDGSVNVDGHVTIRDLNRIMDWNMPDDQAVTIAGLVIHEAQTIPEAEQVFSFHGFRFEIINRRRNQITALKISPLTP